MFYVTPRHVMRNASKFGQIGWQISKQHPREHGRRYVCETKQTIAERSHRFSLSNFSGKHPLLPIAEIFVISDGNTFRPHTWWMKAI